ncbi:zinc-dependent alcohol dehydrogenase [Saccharopolyspora sp. 5N708]|uniref:zinc-dependent alcohol dehydrogenase n=1 Tax=Saccharopolyspora sp. 5N708 TaxID=3457424 RepID=UPI003FCFF79E
MDVPERARAMVATDAYTMESRDIPIPRIGPDDGLLRVEVTAICGTDWEIWGRQSRGAGLGPLILGHENVGRVVAVGDRAAQRWGVAVGDRIAVEEFLPCGTCRLCRGGNYRICEATDSRGGKPFLRYGATPLAVAPALYGGQADYLYLHPRSIVYPVGEDIGPELAALYVPVGNGVRWVVQEGGLQVGETAVVIGPGQHGLGCVVAARVAGAGRVIVVGTARDGDRLEVAKALGADEVVVAADGTSPVESVLDATSGRGADVVVDLAPGATGTVEDALAMAGKRARVLLAASKHGRAVAGFSNDLVVRKELVVRGVRGHDHRSVEPAIDIIRSHRFPLERLCTHRFPLEQAPEAMHVAARGGERGAIHVSVVP